MHPASPSAFHANEACTDGMLWAVDTTARSWIPYCATKLTLMAQVQLASLTKQDDTVYATSHTPVGMQALRIDKADEQRTEG